MFDRFEIFQRDGFTCQCCGYFGNMSNLSVAHRIKQGKGTLNFIKKFLAKNNIYYNNSFITDNMINHEKNVVVACRGACNDSFNIFFNPVERDKLLMEILGDLF